MASLTEERYKQLVDYLRGSRIGSPVYPPGFNANDKRGLRQQAATFEEKDGILYHSSKGSEGKTLRRVIVAPAEKKRLIRACHDGIDGGHFGRDKTLSKLQTYWWKGLANDVAAYCKTCAICQHVNSRLGKAKAELHPIPVTDVWKQIGIDLIGPLPETPRGSKYIITATDYFSKWPEAAPLPDKTAVGVAEFLFYLFCRHGWPERIISDQGREFVNAISRCLFERTDIEHRISSPYHPQTNGLDERTNRTLVQALTKLSTSRTDWDQCIDAALYAYRIGVQDSSKFSPFFLMYNRQPRKAIDHEVLTAVDLTPVNAATLSPVKTTEGTSDAIIDKLLDVRAQFHEKARNNIQRAQQQQKEFYDARHDSNHHFPVGTNVLLKNMKNCHRMGGKLESKWDGPYKIEEKLSKGRYRLRSKQGVLLKKLYSSCLLKEYFEPVQDASQDSTAHPPVQVQELFPSTSTSQAKGEMSESSPLPDQDEELFPSISISQARGEMSESSPLPDQDEELFPSTSTSQAKGETSESSPLPDQDEEYFAVLPRQTSSPSPVNDQINSEQNQNISKSLKRPRSPSPTQHTATFCRCRSRCTAKKSCPCKKTGQLCSSRCHPRHDCTNKSKEKGETIDVEKTREQYSSPSPWCKVGGIQLNQMHKQILQSSRWVDDLTITASQNLLREQHPEVGSLQPPVLAAQLAMEPQGGEFVQLVNINNNHWITLSTVGCQPGHINVYDSLHMGLSSEVKEVIADLMQWKGKEITINYCDVQWQIGGNDCGIFAIAFATAICNGHKPASTVFDQPRLRKHLMTCLDHSELTPFPARSRKRITKVSKKEMLSVHCICRLPDRGDLMIQCAKCKTWYHAACIQIPKTLLSKKSKDNYFCGC